MKYRVAKLSRMIALGFIVGPATGGVAYVFGMAIAAALGGNDVGGAVFGVAILGAFMGLALGWIPALVTLTACYVAAPDRSFGYWRFFVSSNVAALLVFGKLGIFPFVSDRLIGYALIVAATTLAGWLVWGIAKEFGLIVPAA